MFEDRKDTFEAKHAHDQELRFKRIARRNKQLGHWAAELLGKKGEEADEYALEVIKSDFEETGDDDVMRKVAGDLSDRCNKRRCTQKNGYTSSRSNGIGHVIGLRPRAQSSERK